MRVRLATLIATVALAAVAMAVPPARGAQVTLRVESDGAALPLFDGTVSTLPHAVDGGDGSGQHPCWGAPGATASATATGALDDALRAAGIPWQGKWDPSFRDFFVDRIGPYASLAPNHYWSLTVNGSFAAGGCLTQVGDGDSVRFFYGPLFGAGTPGSPDGSGGPPGSTPAPNELHPGAGRPSTIALRRIASAATRFLRDRGGGEAWARLALSLRGHGGPAPAARELLGERIGSQVRDGSFGRDVNATALAVLALRDAKPRAARHAAAWLARIQPPSGGLGYRPGAPADVDTTGLAAWALALAQRRAAASRAAAFVRSAQSPDGGFPAIPGAFSNSQSTGLAIVALRVAGTGPQRTLSASGHSPLDYLASLCRRNGSIAYERHSAPTPVWTTAQALLGLTTSAKLLGFKSEEPSG